MLANKKKKAKITKDNESLKIYIILIIFGLIILLFGFLNIFGLLERFVNCHWCYFIGGIISVVVGVLLISVSFFCLFSKRNIGKGGR